MDLPLFHPETRSGDKLAGRLRSVAQYLFVAVCGLLPILFIPTPYLSVASGKILIVLLALVAIVLFLMMSVLKSGSLTIRYPLALLGIWIAAGVTLLSALLSNDVRDGLFGDGLDSYTALFALVVAVLMSVSVTIAQSRRSVIQLYGVLMFSALAVSLFHIVRLFFGPDTLSLGFFNDATTSPVGSWNGLAIFYGLIILIVIMALQQLPLSRIGRYVAIGVLGLATVILMIINFSPIWWVLAVVTGLFCLHRLAAGVWKDKDSKKNESEDSLEVLLTTVFILIVSIVFLIAGARLSGSISSQIGVSYLEVRPSLLATINIAKEIYSQDALLGAGPNRFVDVWRLKKDPAINETIFWSTPFDSGYSYLATVFIGSGLLSVAAYVLFFIGLIWAGFRFVIRSNKSDKFWHFIGLSSLLASVYFWFMSLAYVPPPTLILLAAVTTGVFMAAYMRLVPTAGLVISPEKGRVYGLVLVAIAVLSTAGMGYVAYRASAEMAGVYHFNKTLATVSEGDTIDELDNRIVEAFGWSKNDAFAAQIAFHQLSRMRTILGVAEPAEAEQQMFQASAARAIEAAQTAVDLDPTNPFNHQLLGQIYAVLAMVGVEGASDRANEAFAKAASYDPYNPVLDLLSADLLLGTKDATGARRRAEDAVRKKSDYTEALFFLAQLDINEGNVDQAITIVNGVAQLEPQNPARRYQLGILLASADKLNEAVAALEAAVALDPQYANARYFLALGYAEQGKTDAAIEQLTIVRDLSESNTMVDELIDQLQNGNGLTQSLTSSETVPERDPQSGKVTETDLESDLVTSSNPVPSDTAGPSQASE